MKTFLLTQDLWDLCKDISGNIALASDPYATAQDAASACRVVFGELYYDTTQGVFYFEQILGHFPPLESIRSQYIAAALTVPGVVDAQCFFSGLVARQLTGQILVTDEQGVLSVAGF